MRIISATAQAAINAEATDKEEIWLITVNHSTLVTPMRFCDRAVTRLSVDPLLYGVVSRLETFSFLPATIRLPDDSPDTPPTVNIVLDNVSRDLVPLLRSVTSPAQVTLEMVLDSDPDTVEVFLPEFDLVSAEYDAAGVSLDLVMNALTSEPYPAGLMTPHYFPGLF